MKYKHRADTMPKTVDTRRHCEDLPQPNPYIFGFWGCGRLLHTLNAVPSCVYSFGIFTLVVSNTYSRLSAKYVLCGLRLSCAIWEN